MSTENVDKYKTAIEIIAKHWKTNTNANLYDLQQKQEQSLKELKEGSLQISQEVIKGQLEIFKEGGCSEDELEILEQYFIKSFYEDGFLQ